MVDGDGEKKMLEKKSTGIVKGIDGVVTALRQL